MTPTVKGLHRDLNLLRRLCSRGALTSKAPSLPELPDDLFSGVPFGRLSSLPPSRASDSRRCRTNSLGASHGHLRRSCSAARARRLRNARPFTLAAWSGRQARPRQIEHNWFGPSWASSRAPGRTRRGSDIGPPYASYHPKIRHGTGRLRLMAPAGVQGATRHNGLRRGRPATLMFADGLLARPVRYLKEVAVPLLLEMRHPEEPHPSEAHRPLQAILGIGPRSEAGLRRPEAPP